MRSGLGSLAVKEIEVVNLHGKGARDRYGVVGRVFG